MHIAYQKGNQNIAYQKRNTGPLWCSGQAFLKLLL